MEKVKNYTQGYIVIEEERDEDNDSGTTIHPVVYLKKEDAVLKLSELRIQTLEELSRKDRMKLVVDKDVEDHFDAYVDDTPKQFLIYIKEMFIDTLSAEGEVVSMEV